MKQESVFKVLHRAIAILAVVLTSLSIVQNAHAFALLGPYADWMTYTNGYQGPLDIGGPMNIGEGYRWNVPVVTYAFDPSFVDAFGTNGIAAVESAIAILNNLPPASQLDPSNFPLNTTETNFSAEQGALSDLKSMTLSLLLEELGLAAPAKYTSALHDFPRTGSVITGNFLDLNFDPFTFEPTNSVNGVHFSYTLYTNGWPDWLSWYTVPTDPVYPSYTAVADTGGIAMLSGGSFYSGLTRDDVGGLRYLFRPDNYAFETLLPDVHGAGTNLNNYVNLALRGGIDKITFVRQDYDPVTGNAYVPLTNDFIDSYMTNASVAHQQLERVVSKPDFIFSAFVPDISSPGIYACTGTSNWLNNSAINGRADGEGPGIIRPQITIAFQKYGPGVDIAQTGGVSDYDPDSFFADRWASFDSSANPPMIFSDLTALQIESLQVNLFLTDTNNNILAYWQSAWTVPIGYKKSALLQTSSNLIDWQSLVTVTNYGMPLEWNHNGSLPQGFLRIVPLTNSP